MSVGHHCPSAYPQSVAGGHDGELFLYLIHVDDSCSNGLYAFLNPEKDFLKATEVKPYFINGYNYYLPLINSLRKSSLAKTN